MVSENLYCFSTWFQKTMEKTIPLKWRTEKRKLADLKDWKRNPRQATAEQKEDLEKSLDKFNLV